jgi:hypothetical protein
MSGDDHSNPKKLLERRYIYLALMATRFRQLRLAAQVHHGGGGRMPPESLTSNDLDTLYEQAVNELEAEDLDLMSNVQLRQELQNALHPQVLEIFHAFDRVDRELRLETICQTPSTPMDDRKEFDPFRDVDWSPFVSILADEHTKVRKALEETSEYSSSEAPSRMFFERKMNALETLLRFHEGKRVLQRPSDAVDDFGVDFTTMSDQSLSLIRQYQTLTLARSALVRNELGHSVITLRSLIPGAGRGVFLDGHARAGSLVAFQPGDVWPKEHLLTNSVDVIEHFEGEDDCHVSLRFDDYVVDSRESPVTVLVREGSMNPWAIGHMVNHPPFKVAPNCQSTMLNFTSQMQLNHLLRFVPNTYARPPGWQSRFFDQEEVVMHGLCLMARRDAANEELVYDYRLQSEIKPDWYSVVEYGDDVLDKDQVVFFRDDWMKK